MNQYGIICCPACKSVKIIELRHKTTHCHKCGKTLTIKKIKLLHKTDSLQEAQYVIGLINAEMTGKKDSFIKEMNTNVKKEKS